jgi:hypothetical protein
MPIDVQCDDCGKKLRLRDDLAGKRIKCPGCGEPLTVTAALEEIEDEPPPRKTAVRSADARPAIKRSRDDDEDERPAPKRRRDEDDEEDERPAAKRRRDDEEDDERPARRRRDDDDEDEEDDRPRKKKGKKKKGGGSMVPIIIGIVAAVLLLLGGGVALLFLIRPGGGASAELTQFIPGDGEGVVSFRASHLWRTPGFKDGFLMGARMQPGAPDPVAKLQESTGLTPEEIDRVTVVLKTSTGGDGTWVIVETTGSIDQAKIKGKFQNPTDANHQNKTYTAGGMQGSVHRMAVYFATAKMAVFGSEGAVKMALDTAVKRTPGPLDDAIALMSSGRHVVAGFNPPPSAMTNLRNMAANPQARQFAPLADFQSGTVTMNISSALDLEATLKFPGDPQAQAAKGAADKGLQAAQGMLVLMKGNVQPQDQAAFASFENALNNIKVQQSGQKLTLTAKFDGFTDALGKMPGMMGGPRR